MGSPAIRAAAPSPPPAKVAALRFPPATHFPRAGQTILDQVTDAIFVFSPDGQTITTVNDAGCRMLGYRRNELLGRSASIVFSQFEDPPTVNGLDLKLAMTQFAVPPFDTVLRAASGHKVEVGFSTSFLRDEADDIVGIVGIARDIRERKQLEMHLQRQNEMLEEEVEARTKEIRASEAKYRSLMEQIPVAVVCTSLAGRVTSFNRTAQQLFKWDKGVLGSDVCRAWGCPCCKLCYDVLKSQGRLARECAMLSQHGTKTYVLHTSSPLHDNAGRTVGVVHTISDLSDPSATRGDLLRDTHGLVLCNRKEHKTIVTRSEKMRKILGLIAVCANSSGTVLIEGESGTGKDLVAQALHLNSDRSNGPYIVVNCATLEEHFLRSELFGHERGAFTGAVAMKPGLVEAADGGTLFVDEVGDMTPEVQAMVLRVLESSKFRRMGATTERQVDIRIIAATNKNLEEELTQGRFRHDLFYRLNVLHITLPPLRERKEDIPLLVEHFLGERHRAGRDTHLKRVSVNAMEVLMAYPWPGNVRELKNVMEQAGILARGSPHITMRHLPQQVIEGAATTDHCGCEPSRSLAEMEMEEIGKVLAIKAGNRTKAAQVLGISRTTLLSKIRKYRL